MPKAAIPNEMTQRGILQLTEVEGIYITQQAVNAATARYTQGFILI